MNTAIKEQRKIISPVNIEDRKKLGIRPGDTVRVWQKIQEKDKTRLQAFEGIVLARKHGNEAGATFTVRRVSDGIGIEKIFPLFSPAIDKIEIIRRSGVRRSKLYYIREKVARQIRRQMRNMKMVDLSTESDAERIKEAQSDTASEDEKPQDQDGEDVAADQAQPDKIKDGAEAKADLEKESGEDESGEEGNKKEE